MLLAQADRSSCASAAVDAAGVRRCVTTEAEYESNAAPIAGVDGRGFVQAGDIPGEAAILVRYMGHVDRLPRHDPAAGRAVRPPAGSELHRPATSGTSCSASASRRATWPTTPRSCAASSST